MSAVLVQNNKRGIVAFADPPSNIEYEWSPAGTPGDIQAIPSSVVTENAHFINAMRTGILSVVEADASTQERLQEQDRLLARKAELQQEAIDATIDHTANRDVASVKIQEDGRKAGEVTPVVFSDTETFDDEGRPVMGQTEVVIDQRV